jgi:hypothetical protein
MRRNRCFLAPGACRKQRSHLLSCSPSLCHDPSSTPTPLLPALCDNAGYLLNMRNARRFLIATLSLLLASLTWWPLMAHLYRPSDQRRAVLRDGLFERQLALFSMRAQRDQTLQTLRWANPEWDLMARTFFVLAATNRALRQTGRAPRVLAAIDSLLDDTLQLIKRHGQEVFLLSYGRKRRWPRERVRSHFVASQVLMMLAARRAVGDAPRWRQAYRQRAAQMVGQLSAPFYSAASYPNELWTFCNAVGASRAEARRQARRHGPQRAISTLVARCTKAPIGPQNEAADQRLRLGRAPQTGA